MPAIAEMLCQRCGELTQAPILAGRSAVVRCDCGGVRQVVRMVRHAGASTAPLPRSPRASEARGGAAARGEAAGRREAGVRGEAAASQDGAGHSL